MRIHFFSCTLFFILLTSCSSKDTDIFEDDTSSNTPNVQTFTLTVTSEEGGSISSNGGTYDQGTSITITATPDDGYQFQGWSNGSTSNPITIILNESVNLTAQFSLIQNSNRNFDFNNVKSIVIKRGSSSKNKNNPIKQYETNIQKINFDGDVSDITIENTSSYFLEALSAFRLNEDYAIITGSFRVVFNNGDVFESGNLLVNLSTGEFYSALNEYFTNITFLEIGRYYKNPHMNSGFQVDGLGRIYKKAYEVDSNIYGIERTDIRISGDTALATIEEVICVAPGSQYFYYQVALSGDILFGINPAVGSKRRDFSYRKSTGETIVLDDFNRRSYDTDLEILGTDDKFLIFRLVIEELTPGNFSYLSNEDNDTAFYDVFQISSTSEGIQIDSLKRINPDRFDNLNLELWRNDPLKLHITYASDDLFFKKDKDGYRNYLKFRHYTDGGVYIVKIKQGISNPEDIQMTSVFSQLLNFTKMSRASRNGSIVETENEIFFADGRNIVQFNMDDMTVNYFVEGSDVSFTSFILQPDDTFLFWGFSLSTSQKVLGEIDRNGTITILDTIDSNVEIQRAFRIGTIGG